VNKQQAQSANREVSESEPRQEPLSESDELVEKEIRERFKKMCEGYFETVSRKLVKEHQVK